MQKQCLELNKITPFLWFDNQAEEAAKFYTSVFKNSSLIHVDPQIAIFELEGQRFMALNGGPLFRFTEAVSFVIDCESQEEVDFYWNKLLADGGSESQCGWLKDQFGLSWQVVPRRLRELLGDPDREKANRAMQAMLRMKKIIIADLEKAALLP